VEDTRHADTDTMVRLRARGIARATALPLPSHRYMVLDPPAQVQLSTHIAHSQTLQVTSYVLRAAVGFFALIGELGLLAALPPRSDRLLAVHLLVI